MQLSYSEILNILPHRPPILMIDSVVSLVPHVQVSALKNISGNEPCLQGHFPRHPVFPGVLIIEAMAQAACILAACSSEAGQGRRLPFLASVSDARFRRPVVPGDQLELQVTCIKARGSFWQLRGLALVRGQVVAEAVLLATEVDDAALGNVATTDHSPYGVRDVALAEGQ